MSDERGEPIKVFGATQDVTSFVTWISSNAGIATISNVQGGRGVATAVAAVLMVATLSLMALSQWLLRRMQRLEGSA